MYAFGLSQFDEFSIRAEPTSGFDEHVRPGVPSPHFRKYGHVGLESDETLKGGRGSTPPIDTGVQVKGCNSHALTLRRILLAVWQS